MPGEQKSSARKERERERERERGEKWSTRAAYPSTHIHTELQI